MYFECVALFVERSRASAPVYVPINAARLIFYGGKSGGRAGGGVLMERAETIGQGENCLFDASGQEDRL